MAYSVAAPSSGAEIAVTRASAGAATAEPFMPEAAEARVVGRGNWQRTVTMIAPPEVPAGSLLLGETLNPPGNWSGVPAHKHDTPRPGLESVHEELYYFRVDPAEGWGVQRVYEPGGRDELLLLQDRVVTVMPRGYHTVAAAPGFTLYYAFVLSGPARALLPSIDPAQAHLTA
jgi:5-deoxy-glucuronate isomerase